ncbi:MAG: hypothetical protein CMJ18_20560 [Phycisphaeraceae bacterium]|nr:hypothetical protein [Phycisphaeraceae bacterium]
MINRHESPSPSGEVFGERWLDRLAPGQCGTVTTVDADVDDAHRLKAMGVCAGRLVMLVKSGDPLILRVLGTRIGISRRLAAAVRVLPCRDQRCTPSDGDTGDAR